MDRRRYLALLAAVGLAGCQGGDSDSDDGENADGADGPTDTAAPTATSTATDTATAAGTPSATPTATSVGSYGLDRFDLPLSEEKLSRGAPKDAIPAITDPVFAENWSSYAIPPNFNRDQVLDVSLEPDDDVIGVERDGEARAYPLRVLNWHEVVNDTFGGPLLVTFCPLCGSGVTAVRRVDGEETTFGVSGLLWNSDLVMYDEATGSLWSQILGAAVRGEMTGTRLELVPSTMTTWSEWRETHPETTVLVPPPDSSTVVGNDAFRNYARNPYAGYDQSSNVGVGRNDFSDDRLHPKAQVLGIAHDGVARAYHVEDVTGERVINDSVGGLAVVVAATPEDAMVAYERDVDGETLTFEETDDPAFLRAGGSRWRVTTGRAVDGPHEGTQLAAATDLSSMFWFAWADFHPDSEIYGR